MEMKRELQKNERDKTKQYWNMVSLLSTVLDHNNLSEAENQDNIIFFTKQMYLQLQEKLSGIWNYRRRSRSCITFGANS